MTISRRRAAAILASAAALPGRAWSQTSAPATIRICGFPADSYAEPYFAADQGFLARAGINLEFVTLPNAGGIAQAVTADIIDVGMCDPIQVANPYIAGVPLTFFGGSGMYSTNAPTTLLVVANGSPLHAAKDFEGRTIALIALASISSLAVKEWLRQNGADQTKVRLVELPFGAMLPAMQRGTIDAALLAEPFLSSSRDSVRVVGKAFDAIAKSFYISSFFTKREWLQKNKDLAKTFLGVMYDTARWANAHHSETAVILSKNSKLELDRVRSMTRVNYATSFDPKGIQPVLDVALRYGQLPRSVGAAEIITAI